MEINAVAIKGESTTKTPHATTTSQGRLIYDIYVVFCIPHIYTNLLYMQIIHQKNGAEVWYITHEHSPRHMPGYDHPSDLGHNLPPTYLDELVSQSQSSDDDMRQIIVFV
jgi:hypothetical protein